MSASENESKKLHSDIIDRVREIRIQQGLSQVEFAKRIGVSPGNVGDWESPNKRSSPGVQPLLAIASGFDVSLDWLLLGKSQTKPNDNQEYLQKVGRVQRNEEHPLGISMSKWEENYHYPPSSERESISKLIPILRELPDEDIAALYGVAIRLAGRLQIHENKKRPPYEDRGLTIREKNLPEHYYVRLPLVGQVPAGDPIAAIENVDEFIDVPADLVDRPGTYFVLKVKGYSMKEADIIDGNLVIVKQQPDAENGEIVVAMTNEEDVTVKTFYREDGYIRLQPQNKEMEPIISRDVKILGKVIAVYRQAK